MLLHEGVQFPPEGSAQGFADSLQVRFGFADPLGAVFQQDPVIVDVGRTEIEPGIATPLVMS